MGLRLGVDLDGTLADLGASLDSLSSLKAEPTGEPHEPRYDTSGSETTARRVLGGAEALRNTPHLKGASSQVWRRASEIEDFWETLDEIEPGSVCALDKLGRERGWETIFLTSRPGSRGSTTQRQSQRWLVDKGFVLPSVFVTNGSRGKIADALGLDVVVDDNPENCVDVTTDSNARPVLVWRGVRNDVPNGVKKLGVGAVSTMTECLTLLEQLDDERRPGGLRRAFRRLFGLRG